MSLKSRILICLIASLPLTLIALFLDKGSLSMELSRLFFVFILGVLIYAPTLYAAFLSENKEWTRTLTARLLKSLALGSGIVALGVLGLYFQASAHSHLLSVNWFGLFWLLILFSGMGFTRTFTDKTTPAA